jgi:hypothetical protein
LKFSRPERVSSSLRYSANHLDGTITDGGELTYRYSNEGEVKMRKQEIIAGDQARGFEAVERDGFITGWKI